MIDLEINIAIAKAINPDASDAWIEGFLDGQNDYCHDLNAMREAVLDMDEDNQAMWFNNLCNIVNRDRDLGLDAMSLFALINATAHQRAEAFCRTFGVWK